MYSKNVEKSAKDREQLENSTSISISLVVMFVFGLTDPETCCKYRNDFVVAFCKAKNLEAWKKVLAAPLTKAFLGDSKFWHEMVADEYE